MLLDVVLDRPEITWLATEKDKVAHCVHKSGFKLEDLPSLVFEQRGSKTVRYFPDKLPIGLGGTADELLFVNNQPLMDVWIVLENGAKILPVMHARTG